VTMGLTFQNVNKIGFTPDVSHCYRALQKEYIINPFSALYRPERYKTIMGFNYDITEL